jgi:L-histidine Nalpha-methyltransferase
MISRDAAPKDADRSFAADVRAGLCFAPKALPAKYFYDALGSHLFEAICQLPWYPITRTEDALLERFAAEMVQPLSDPATIVELGCGSGQKLALLAGALSERTSAVTVHLVDISAEALDLSQRTLSRLPHVSVLGHRAAYEAGLARATRERPSTGTTLVLFLGSNIGNFHPPDMLGFLQEVRHALRPGDTLLLGADLVKSRERLELAYDDPLGVTAAFNKNILLRINRELGGDFDLTAFDHRAIWNEGESRVEMHLVSRRAQKVHIEGAGCEVHFAQGESIWTESSYKFTPDRLVQMGKSAGFRCREQWSDWEGGFCATLFVAEKVVEKVVEKKAAEAIPLRPRDASSEEKPERRRAAGSRR